MLERYLSLLRHIQEHATSIPTFLRADARTRSSHSRQRKLESGQNPNGNSLRKLIFGGECQHECPCVEKLIIGTIEYWNQTLLYIVG